MQLNQALFMLGGRSGYVLQPDIMRDETFDPFDKNSLKIVEPITVQLQASGQGWQVHPKVATVEMRVQFFQTKFGVSFYMFKTHICSLEFTAPSSAKSVAFLRNLSRLWKNSRTLRRKPHNCTKLTQTLGHFGVTAVMG